MEGDGLQPDLIRWLPEAESHTTQTKRQARKAPPLFLVGRYRRERQPLKSR